MQALIRASDLADEIWHLWLESEGKEEVAPGGSAAVGCKDEPSAHLGSLRFIVDTGCGHTLTAEKSIHAGGTGSDLSWRAVHGSRLQLRLASRPATLLISSQREALGQWMRAAAAGKPATPERRCCVTSGAKTFLDDVESAVGPPLQSIQSRVTIGLLTQEMIGNHGYADGRPAAP
eukprot:8136827-Pyramimonas_sp.AAC.1